MKANTTRSMLKSNKKNKSINKLNYIYQLHQWNWLKQPLTKHKAFWILYNHKTCFIFFVLVEKYTQKKQQVARMYVMNMWYANNKFNHFNIMLKIHQIHTWKEGKNIRCAAMIPLSGYKSLKENDQWMNWNYVCLFCFYTLDSCVLQIKIYAC